MPSLLEIQHAMARAIVSGDYEAVASQIVSGALSRDDCLDVYRNGFLGTLTKALRLSYPAVLRLVGEEFFDGAAQRFIQAHAPQSAHLDQYGGEFPLFLAQFPPAASLPYLADVARLEWAVSCAFHAPDDLPLDAHALAESASAPPERLVLVAHPSLSLLGLDHPAEAIWRAVLAEDVEALSAIDLSAGPDWLLVERTRKGVEISRLSETEWRFAAALCAGEIFAHAVEAATGAEVSFLLANHLTAGRFTAFYLKPASLEDEA
jgi:hypothetical protein